MTATLGDLTQIPVTTNPTQGLPALGDVMVTLYNQDITNLVYISYQPWFKPGLGNSIPIQPLTSVTISAKRAIYVASTVGGLASLLVLPEGSQANPSPAQIAAQINALGLAKDTSVNAPSYNPITLANPGLLATQATLASQTGGGTIANEIAVAGTPPLANPDVLINTNFSVASGANNVQGPVTITKPGYEVLFNCHSAGVTNTFCALILTWIDPQTGNKVDQQTYWILPGADATTNLHSIQGFGSTVNEQLQVQVNAYNNTVVVDKLLVHQNSRTYPRHDFRTFFNGSYAGGIGSQPNDMQALVMINSVVSQATGTHATFYTPLFSGPVQIWAFTASATTDMTLTANIFTDQAFGGTPNVFQFKSDSGGEINAQVYLPRAQMQVLLNNGNAATKQLSLNMTMAEI